MANLLSGEEMPTQTLLLVSAFQYTSSGYPYFLPRASLADVDVDGW